MGHFPFTGHIARARNMAQSGNLTIGQPRSWTASAEVAGAHVLLTTLSARPLSGSPKVPRPPARHVATSGGGQKYLIFLENPQASFAAH